jgi:hypothetical protein
MMGGEEASLIDVTGSISRKLLLCCWAVPPTYSEVVMLVGAVQEDFGGSTHFVVEGG